MYIYESLTKIMPKGYVKKISQMLIYANEESKISQWIGKTLFFSILLSIVGTIVGYFFDVNILLIIGGVIAILLIGQFFVYLLVYFKVDNRNSKIEKSLPDALQLIASNLQAGMIPYMAIRIAARKEFGPLAEELKKATEKAVGMKSFSEELLKICNRVDSSPLKRTLKLIASSLSSGGHLASLLEELSEDIAETSSLKDEMVTNTRTYAMFIMFTIIVGTPLLLAISIHFVGMVENMQGSATLSTDEFGLGFLAGEMEITQAFLTNMSLIILSITGLLASMFTGTISKGEMTAGFKYAPAVIIASLVLFVLSKMIIGSFFSGL